MDLEEQTLRYYLKVFSVTLIFILILSYLFIFTILNKNINLKNNSLSISKGESIESIIKKNIYNISKLEIYFIKNYIKFKNLFNNKFIHYGDFFIQNNTSFLKLINIITKPSNILYKITIIEGWSQKKLNIELAKYFKDFYPIKYSSIIADTYFFQKNSNFDLFIEKLKKNKSNYFIKKKNNKLLSNFSEKEIMIMGSLLEKEGLDDKDKKLISSVIFNRLNKKMKLQVDATVIYSITKGNYDLNRKLLFSDLKIDDPFNTYFYRGLPPTPISYVGKETLDILFENYNSDFLFYFYNNSLNRHIFSKTFEEHKEKLNEFRNK